MTDGSVLPTWFVGPGHGLLAAAAGLAILNFTYGNFAPIWQPLPMWIPWHELWVYGSALLLLAAGAGLCFPRTAVLSALTISAYLAIWALTRAGILAGPPLGFAWRASRLLLATRE